MCVRAVLKSGKAQAVEGAMQTQNTHPREWRVTSVCGLSPAPKVYLASVLAFRCMLGCRFGPAGKTSSWFGGLPETMTVE